jgi:hypothetical protein
MPHLEVIMHRHVTSPSPLFNPIYYLILMNLLFFAILPNAVAGETIRINGSGSGLEMMKAHESLQKSLSGCFV